MTESVVLNLRPSFEIQAVPGPTNEVVLPLTPRRWVTLDVKAGQDSPVDLRASRTALVSVPPADLLQIELAQVLRGDKGNKGDKGDRGLIGPSGGINYVYSAATAISGHRIVILDGESRVEYATNTELLHAGRILGMTTHAAAEGADINVQKFGEITEPSWNWNTNFPVYLGVDGFLTQAQPTAPAAKFQLVVGFPISSVSLFVNVLPAITLIS